METQPSIVLTGHLIELLEEGFDHELGAFVHIVETDLGCRVIPSSLWDLKNDQRLQDLHRRRLLVLVATNSGYTQEDRNNRDNKEVVEEVVEAFGDDLPIIIFPHDPLQYGDNLTQIRSSVYSAPMYSRELHELISQLRDCNPGVQDEKRLSSLPGDNGFSPRLRC